MGSGARRIQWPAQLGGLTLPISSIILLFIYCYFSAMLVERMPRTLAWWKDFLTLENLAALPTAVVTLAPSGSSLLLLSPHIVIVVFGAGYLVSLWRCGSPSVDVIAVAVYAIAIVVVECLVLGTLGYLYAGSFWLLHSALLLTCLFSLSNVGRRQRYLELLRDIRASLLMNTRHLFRAPFGRLLMFSLLFFVPWLLFLGLAFYPTAADASKYHLPPLVRWWQEGSFVSVQLGTPFADSYPKNVNMLSLFSLVVTRDPVFFRLIQLPFALFGTYICMVMARLCGARRRDTAVAGAFFFLTPVVQTQSTVALVDVAVCVLLLCATLFLMQYARERSIGSLMAFATAAGLTLGSKFSMIAPVAVLITVYLALALFAHLRGVLGRNQALVQIAATGLVIGCLGLYWYVRNFLIYANPVWPFAIKLFDGAVRIPGTHQLDWLVKQATWNYHMAPLYPSFEEMSVFDALLSSWTERLPFYGAAMCAHGGLGIQWFVFGLPCAFAATLVALRQRRAAFLLMLLSLGASWFLTDAPAVARYTIYLGGLGGIALAVMFGELPSRVRRIYAIGAMLALLLSAVLVSNQQDEQDYRPDTPLRVATSGRLMPMHRMDMQAYEALVPKGSEVAFYCKVRSDVYYFYGHDLSRRIESLPPPLDTPVALLRSYPYLVVPTDGQHDTRLQLLPDFERIGEARPYQVYRRTQAPQAEAQS